MRILDFHGTTVTVPQRYPSYPPKSKELIAKTIVKLQSQYGSGLHRINIIRVAKRKGELVVYFDLSYSSTAHAKA
jgi:hypothetical protein